MHNQTPLELVRGNSKSIHASVIWLHGLGADGFDFAPIVEKLNLAQVRFILPHAPAMPVTRNNGYVMPAWYDLYHPSEPQQEDLAGILHSEKYLSSLIQNELDRGIASDKIVLAGFSQGGAIALHTAARYPHTLAGVLALSTYLPLKSALATEASKANLATPIFMAHGSHDDIISMEKAQLSRLTLQQAGFNVIWHEYAMAHNVCAEEINDIRLFLQGLLQQDLVE
ncbi:MAG: dienelactone hydrolase family protein [Methylotenera sp.]|nr:dienelactone hydrolase family protein [Methylotenera sp.]